MQWRKKETGAVRVVEGGFRGDSWKVQFSFHFLLKLSVKIKIYYLFNNLTAEIRKIYNLINFLINLKFFRKIQHFFFEKNPFRVKKTLKTDLNL